MSSFACAPHAVNLVYIGARLVSHVELSIVRQHESSIRTRWPESSRRYRVIRWLVTNGDLHVSIRVFFVPARVKRVLPPSSSDKHSELHLPSAQHTAPTHTQWATFKLKTRASLSTC
jgi:hypothetical protein